jgi:hypothetical protein
MPLVKSALASGLKDAFDKMNKSKDKEENGNGLYTSPKAAKEIAKAYYNYASAGLADTCTVAAQAADFESGMLSAPTPAGLDAGLAAYWKPAAVTAVAPYTAAVTSILGPLGYSFGSADSTKAAADQLADALHTYTTSQVQVVGTLPPPASPKTLMIS